MALLYSASPHPRPDKRACLLLMGHDDQLNDKTLFRGIIGMRGFQMFGDQLPDGVYEADLNGTLVYCNPALAQMLGRSQNRIQGRSYKRFVDEVNAEILSRSFSHILQTGTSLANILCKVESAAGLSKWVEISAVLIKDPTTESTTGFRGIVRDVSDACDYQDQLETSEQRIQDLYRQSIREQQRFRAFLEFLPDPVVVLDMTQRVIYLNSAFERVFGWSLSQLEGRALPFVPDHQKESTDGMIAKALAGQVINGFKTKRLTKSGRRLDTIMGAALLYDATTQPSGLVLTLIDVTQRRHIARSRRILLSISRALHRYRQLDRMLSYITHLIQALMRVGGASVILLDDDQQEFYYYVTAYDDKAAGQKFETIRFPVDKGVPGEVYRTGRPVIVPNYATSKYAIKAVDELVHFNTQNLLSVPLRIQDRLIGVLGAVNKKEGQFDSDDVELLTAIADVVAAPIENTRITEALQASYRQVHELNQAKDTVIAHLSHELKTPLAVLSASLKLLEPSLSASTDAQWRGAFERAERNLQRLLEMEYAIEDILRQGDDASFGMMTQLPKIEPSSAETQPEEGTKFFQEVNIEFLIHELKDPLSVIETNTHMVLADKIDDTQTDKRKRRSLQRIVRSTQKAREILNALLEVGRADAVSFTCQSFQAAPLVGRVLIEAVESHDPALYEKIKSLNEMSDQLDVLSGNGIRLEIHPSVRKTPVAMDEMKFHQIVANLFKNAISHRRNMVLIQLACKHDAVNLSVRDDGPGIAHEHHEKIFERYKQVSPWPGVARHGHGLGLAVARILARAMGGDIALESQLGHGALFQLTLPLTLHDEDDPQAD